jgi:1-acyl-sn-glycerol-3-phosphate acyltransferase
MEGFFLFLYDFFRNKRFLFFTIVVAVFIAALYLASRIRFEEDINKMISGIDRKSEITSILSQSGFLDKIVINVFPSDTSAQPEPEKLLKYGRMLADTLLTPEFRQYIGDVKFRLPDDAMENVFNIIYGNLPVFLDESDYVLLDSMISPAMTRQALESSYNSLLSPASFAMKRMIVLDPAGLSSIATRKLSAFRSDENYITLDGTVFSKDKKHLLIFLTTRYSSSSTSKNELLIRKLNSVITGIVKYSNNYVAIEYFGTAVVAAGNAERLKKDITLTLTITIILLFLIIGFSIRKKKLIPFIFLPAVFGGIVALAVIYLLQAKISIISLSIGTVILAITVDYALHITTHYKHRHSVTDTIRDVSFPIIVCGFATAFEFISLVFVSSESLHELGILAAVSVITASFFTMVVIPHVLDVTRKETDATEEKNYLERILDKITNYDFDKNKLLLGFMVIVTIVCWIFKDKVGFETDMMKMNYMSDELAQAEENLNRINSYKLNSVYAIAHGENLEEALRSNERLLIKGKEFLDQKKVRSFSSPGEFLFSDSLQKRRIERWNNFWSNGRKEKYISSFNKAAAETGFRSGSFTGFYNLINKDYSPIDTGSFGKLRSYFYADNINSRPGLATVVSVIKTDDHNKLFVEKEIEKINGIVVLDRKSMLSELINVLGHDFNFIANVSLSLILIILIIAFGRFELGFITFIPIFLSWIWTLGIMAITGIRFNIFNIIISSFITGLGIDYSIYIMQGLVQGYKSDNRNLLSYKTCILLSVMISISGTGVMILAKHPALNSIAVISIIGLLSVVLISYTFEPVLFNWLVRKNGKSRILPVTLSDILFTIVSLSAGIALCIVLNVIFLFILLLPFSRRVKKRIMHYVLMWCLRLPGYAMVNIRKKLINESKEGFSRPSLIISNHQSHLDLPLLLMLNPKIIILTTDWVWNNPLYALVIRYLNFYPVTWGYETLIEKLKKEVEEGYSILVFPEGTRSPDSHIQRFHKGAFLLAEKLELDIIPVIIHGAGDCMNKGENHLRRGSVTLKIFHRVKAGDKSYGNDYHERTRFFLNFFRNEYGQMKTELETPSYFRKKLVRNYIYKGPVLEWYTRIKLRLENNYDYINKFVPREAEIVDIGCGYGIISYMLNFTSDKRKILGIDYDNNKIVLANNCISKNDRVNFVSADAVDYDYPDADVFILSDVVHYIPEEKQSLLVIKCIEKLNPGGLIIIRDADKDLQKRHLGTRYTEFFSTRFGYNKTVNKKLYFFSGRQIKDLAARYKMHLEVVDSTKLTSNILYILRKDNLS